MPPRPSLEHRTGRTVWASAWTEGSPLEEILWVHWKRLWTRLWTRRAGELPDHRPDSALAALPLFLYDALKKHRQLYKHESSLLIQIRTGKVGLRAFLFERKAPEVATPQCPCGEAPETAAYLVLNCRLLNYYRDNLSPLALRTYSDFAAATEKRRSASKLVH
jgi:hypothetical protein